METPVLTKLQKKLSLSGKKQKKEKLKNVLGNPHQTYWPLVSSELETLRNLLREKLPRVRCKKINVPWNILKHLSKEDRRSARQEYIKKHGNSETIRNEEKLIFGVNEVTKYLERNSCSIILVADVNPRILVQHIFDLAVLQEIPVLVIPGLNLLLKECCGLQSMTVAIRKDINEGSDLYEIKEAVKEVYKSYPPDPWHINSKRCEQTSNNKEKVDAMKTNSTTQNKQPKKCHLHRSSLNERVFVPEKSESRANLKSTGFGEFLSFNSEVMNLNDNSNSKKRKKLGYKPLTVKRLQGNKNRHKEKVKLLKKNIKSKNS